METTQIIAEQVSPHTLEDRFSERTKSTDNRSLFRKITDVYFAPKRFEKNGTLYKSLGVKRWKNIVMGTVGRVIRNTGTGGSKASMYFIGDNVDSESLSTYENYGRVAELIHASFLAQILYQTINSIGQGNVEEAVLSGLGVLINGYCVMLQRYNRERVYKVKKRMEGRRKTSPLRNLSIDN